MDWIDKIMYPIMAIGSIALIYIGYWFLTLV